VKHRGNFTFYLSFTVISPKCLRKREFSEGIKLFEYNARNLMVSLGCTYFRISQGDTLKLWILVSCIKVSSIPMGKWLQIEIQLTVSVGQVQPYENNSPADQPTAEQPFLLRFYKYSPTVIARALTQLCPHRNSIGQQSLWLCAFPFVCYLRPFYH
jgi:hypothetical protein